MNFDFSIDRDRDRAGRRRRRRRLHRPHPAPAWRCYGRVWEKVAAGFLTLFILGTLLGIGAAIGLPSSGPTTSTRSWRAHRPTCRDAAAQAEPRAFLDALDEVSEAVESGAGLPEVARAAGRALDASVIVLDAASSVLAVACESTEDERAVMAGEGGAETVDLRVADAAGRPAALPAARRAAAAGAAAAGREPDRARGRPRARRPSAPPRPPSATSSQDLLARRMTDRENIVARAGELGCDLAAGAERDRRARTSAAARGGRLARARPDRRRARRARRSSAASLAALARPAGAPGRDRETPARPSASW